MRHLERALQAAARDAFGDRARQQRRVAAAVRARSERYNAPDRRAAPADDNDPFDLLARLLFYTASDAARPLFPLAELAALTELPRRVRLLDLGAGCGAMTFGVVAALDALGHRCRVEATLVDRDRRALDLARRVGQQWRGPTDALLDRLTVRRRRVDSGAADADAGFDLAVAGTLLNELPEPDRLPVVEAMLAATTPHGFVLLMEPALRRTSRGLHRIHDAVLDGGLATVVAPCPHQRPCPALTHEADWCHERRPWTMPEGLSRLTNATGLRRRDLRWSYLLLAHDPVNVASLLPGGMRVVSKPLRSKGRQELFVCGEGRRLRAVRRKGQRSPANRPFGRVHRGRLLRFDPVAKVGKGTLVVDRDTQVTAVDPAE